jgi:hypothetical protein
MTSTKLEAYEKRYRALARAISRIGFISRGSVIERKTSCGKPNCRCQADPPQLHGPYWQWTSKVEGKTVTRRLTAEQARLYEKWIANGHDLDAVLAEMDEVSTHAITLLLKEALSRG